MEPKPRRWELMASARVIPSVSIEENTWTGLVKPKDSKAGLLKRHDFWKVHKSCFAESHTPGQDRDGDLQRVGLTS